MVLSPDKCLASAIYDFYKFVGEHDMLLEFLS